MSDKIEDRGQTGLERVLLHIVQAITVAGIIGGYVALSELQTSNAVMQTEIRNFTSRFEDFRVLVDDRYTATQAARDIKPLVDKVSDHETRLRQLEGLRFNPK